MATNSHVLRARLHRDLAELRDIPYPGVAVFADDADMFRFCLVLTPPSGPWKDLSLHFDVQIPSNWPASPPSVESSVHNIDHPNLFGSYICCDLLKDQRVLAKGYSGGYTPALTLRGLFLQFLTFFSSTKVEQDYGGDIEIGDYMISCYRHENEVKDFLSNTFQAGGHLLSGDSITAAWHANPSPERIVTTITNANGQVVQSVKSTRASADRIHKFEQQNPRWKQTHDVIVHWKCMRCPYGSEALPHHRVNSPPDAMDVALTYNSPPQCLLHLLNDDVLLTLTYHLPSESIISFSQAYPRFAALVNALHILTQRELQCFFLRTPLQDSVLGIGIAWKSRMLSSDFDWLSETAFYRHHVRKSIQKRDFHHFLPLAFSQPHFERVVDKIWYGLATINSAVHSSGAPNKGRTPKKTGATSQHRHESVNVVYKMMNNIVVALMRSCDDVVGARGQSPNARMLYASEKAVISYCHLFHLLICLNRKEPAVLREATMKLRGFVEHPGQRIKQYTPDMGELIVLVMLVLALPPMDKETPMTWDHLNGPFLQEAIVRNVRWVLKDSPELEVTESGASDYRLETTFTRSKTSLRLIMFQIAFLDIFIGTYASNISRLDDNYGFAEKELPERMVEEIKSIYQVKNWPTFFRRIKYATGERFGKEALSQMLRDAMQTSGERRYHNPKSAQELQMLAPRRRDMEAKWQSALLRAA